MKTNKEMKDTLQEEYIVKFTKPLRLTWYGHVECKTNDCQKKLQRPQWKKKKTTKKMERRG